MQQKLLYWDNTPADILNYYTFLNGSVAHNLEAQYWSVDGSVIIQNDFLSVPGADPPNDSIDFKDPWLILEGDPDYYFSPYGYRNLGHDDAIFETHGSPFNPNINPDPGVPGSEYKGVFLNQDPEFDPDIPNYSVRAPQSIITQVHGQNTPFYFATWEGEYEEVAFQNPQSRETAVVFKQSNAKARALFKGHLLSGNSAATAHNNGRRVVRDGEGTLHAVYEDGGQIWYTYSDDAGETWAPETRVDDQVVFDVYKHQYPSIAEIGGVLHVSWTFAAYIEGEPVDAQVKYRMKNISQGQWEPVKNVGPTISPVTTVPKPAIGLIDVDEGQYVIISYNKADELSEIVTYYQVDGGNFVLSSSIIEGNDPSISADETHTKARITYDFESQVYQQTWDAKSSANIWKSAQMVSTGIWWASLSRNSNVSYSDLDDRSHVVWAAQNEIRNPVVIYRNFDSPSNPGQLTYFNSGEINSYPTVAVDETWGKITIFFEEDGDIIRRQKSGDYWTEKTYGAGWYPNIAGHGEYGAIWAKESSAPYRIQSDYTIPESPLEGGDPLAEDTLMINKRLDFTFMQDTTVGHLTLHLENLDAGSRWLQFNRQLHTRQITVPPNAAARFNLRCRFHNLTFPVDTMTVLFNISFDEGNVVRLLGTLRVKDLLAFNTGQYHNIPQTIPMGFLAGKRGRLKLSFGENLPVISDVVVRRDSGEVRIPLGKAGGDDEPSPAAIPAEFKLHQNYPNPFNPTTTITFSLPENVFVNLQIYDITGRKVRTLADHPFPAGVHQVVWDGRNDSGEQVSSGIYVYRIEAGKFTESRKMVMLQ